MDKRIAQLPSWLWTTSNTVPPMYRRIWEGVREDRPNLAIAQGDLLVDTNKVFPLLLTSQLPTEVLGYIWSLANHKYSGQLTEQELYVVLALVAIAQASYTFNSLDVLYLMPTPPIPNLNVAMLDQRRIVEPKLELKIPTAVPQVPIVSNPSFDGRQGFNAKAELKNQFALSPASGSINAFSDGRHNFQTKPETKTQLVDFNDEFSDFQSAPTPSVLTIPVLDLKQGSAIGSRLANHNLGVKKPNEKPKKLNINRNAHSSGQLRNTATGMNTVSHGKDILSTDRLTELFPKCTIKNQAKTVILKDTAIRSNDLPQDSNFSHKDSMKFIDNVNPPAVVIPSIPACPKKVTSRKEFEINQQDLMSVQTVEDKYSALRVLVEDPPQSVQPILNSTNVIPPVDDFGDFVSAEQPTSTFSTGAVQNSSASIDFLTDFEFKETNIHIDNKAESSLVQEISEAFNTIKIECNTPPTNEKFDHITETVIQKEDTISVNSIEIGNGVVGLVRSGSVPSLDLKSFLPTGQDDDQQPENMHQLIYWEWKQYMESCVVLLQVAANIFTSIKSKVVLNEVLSTAQGYNFLCNLAEVAAVCRRVNFSHKEMDINIMGFDDLLMDIDKIWAEMEPFYANIPIVTELPTWPSHQGENTICSLCLTVVTSGRVAHNDNCYHVTCANLWLNCVHNNLPALSCPPLQPHATVALSNSHI